MWKQRGILKQFVKRDVAAKYRDSMLGLMWALLVPLLMLGVYSFVFGVVFKARFPEMGRGVEGEFALILFSGLILHALLADGLSATPTLITSNANLVKKVIFPVEILVPSIVFTALVQLIISFGVLLLALFFVYGSVPLTALWLPIILFPFIILCMGLFWAIAALGVYIPDIRHIMGMVSTLLLFISTIFYPASRLPDYLQWVLYLNPLSVVVDQIRLVLFGGVGPQWHILAAFYFVSFAVFYAGYMLFLQLRKGFADVV
jgi:lipopolysaccharide transport system permease protein